MTIENELAPDSASTDVMTLHARIAQLEERVEQLSQREAVLLRKEDVLHATLNSTTDGILAVDEGGHVIASNRQFVKMWHIPPDLMESGDDNELLHFVLDQLESPDTFICKVRDLYQSWQASSDILKFRDGRVFRRFSLPLVIDDKLCGRVWTFRDVGNAETSSEPSGIV